MYAYATLHSRPSLHIINNESGLGSGNTVYLAQKYDAFKDYCLSYFFDPYLCSFSIK